MMYFLIIILGLLLKGYTMQVRVHCQTTSPSQCTSKYKYSITGNNLNTHYCLGHTKTCNLDYDVTYTLYNCSSDFKNQQCYTKVCYISIPNQQFCTTDIKCTGINGGDSYNFLCSQCNNVDPIKCPNCFSSQKNGYKDINQYCIDKSCAGIGGQINIHSCPNRVDTYNLDCSCCMTTKIGLPTCTANNIILSITEVTNWVKSQDITIQNNDQMNVNITKNSTNKTYGKIPAIYEEQIKEFFVFGIFFIGFLIIF